MTPELPEQLRVFGWDGARAAELAALEIADAVPARIVVRHKGMYTVQTADGEVYGRIKGYLRYKAETWAELPVVGDWVAIARKPHEKIWHIQAVLERRTALVRKVPGLRSMAQVLAANITDVVIVMGLTEDYNLRRLERYLVLVHESGASPCIALNKSDLLDKKWLKQSLKEVAEISRGAPTVTLSALDAKSAHKAIGHLLGEGRTLVFVGSSGAGKSTLVNALLGQEHFLTGEVRESDGRGRHTTTVREMVRLPQGAVLIDSPGIREIQLIDAETGLEDAFADIATIAEKCKFRDCSHTTEPGCAVLAAIEDESLDPARYENFLRLQGELGRQRSRQGEWGETNRRAFKETKRKR